METLVPLWIFKWPKQPPQISALLQYIPKKVANSAPSRAISEFDAGSLFLPLIIYRQIEKSKLSNIYSVLNKLAQN